MEMGTLYRLSLPLLFLLTAVCLVESATLEFSETDYDFQLNREGQVFFSLSHPLNDSAVLSFEFDTHTVISPIPDYTVEPGVTKCNITLHGLNAGSLENAFIRITVVHNNALVTLSAVIGWIYFAAWSVSFYPQIVENFRRKSVIGLNFDFLSLNLTGFIAYAVFNVCVFWIPVIQDEYFEKHPYGVLPVAINDVFFALHAIFATLVTILQCFIYERGSQTVSRPCVGFLVVAWAFAIITLCVAIFGKLAWLQYLYFFSYIKLVITLIKYMPQVYMNFKRKSTDGWSIGNILLDFTGGSLSILQMFLMSYNNDDWSAIFGNPTKFGLGMFSVLFDVLFIVQHYILYRGKPAYEPIVGNSDSSGYA
ncbi:PREDICTED: cystinosin-like isoform X2 [Priapulus caudatus]|uniref:Cystinosin-like isoform X2 n=1 Tax=Priapulus caudatus TaxID=37621 RepID=A0ABM1E4E9_PRICU|nr:PREDICTED: cystinosin-like isoform X2 [Priapulus caudatus]